MSDLPILREFTMTHDPDTRAVTVVMLVQHGTEQRRYEYGGALSAASAPGFGIEEHCTRVAVGPLDSVPVGPRQYRVSLDVAMDTATSAVTTIPAPRCRRCFEEWDVVSCQHRKGEA